MLAFFDDISADLAVVDRELHRVLRSNDPLLTETASHLLKAGGKRLRPAFALLAAKFHRYDLAAVLPLAMALELIHMATLVHDDVVDAALTRRGTPTVKALWGNRVSTHTGDYLLARALICVSEYPDEMIPRDLARACVLMAEGELLQLEGANRPNLRQYLKRIKGKTAVLIEASCKLGAVATGAPPSIYRPLGRYGYYLGMAFQIPDDILDMVADERRLGKPVGGDIRQGVITLPVIYALERSTEARALAAIIAKPEKTREDIREAIRITKEGGGIDFAFRVADRYLAKARAQLERLPAVPARDALARIAEFVRARGF